MASARGRELEIDEDLAHQQRSWVVQSIGQVVLLAIVVGALAGMLGSGPLSRSTVTAEPGLEVEYERFARYQDAGRLTLRLGSPLTAGDRVRVAINREFLEHSRIEGVVPQPEAQETGGGGVISSFRVAERGQPMTISYRITPERVGILEGVLRVELAGTPSPQVRFRRWTYP